MLTVVNCRRVPGPDCCLFMDGARLLLEPEVLFATAGRTFHQAFMGGRANA